MVQTVRTLGTVGSPLPSICATWLINIYSYMFDDLVSRPVSRLKMSDRGQRQRSKRPTAIDFMEGQAARSHDHGEDPSDVLRDQASKRLTSATHGHHGHENPRPYNREGRQSSAQSNPAIERGGQKHGSAPFGTSSAVDMETTLQQRAAHRHGIYSSKSSPLRKRSIDRENHALTYQERYFRDSAGRLHPQTYLYGRNGHPFPRQGSTNQEVSSRPAYQLRTPTDPVDQSHSSDPHQRHVDGASVKSYPSAYYPVQHADTRVAPYYLRRPNLRYTQYSQAREGLRPFPESTHRSSRPSFKPNLPLAPRAASFRTARHVQRHRGAKHKNLCNNHHLRGACILGDACRYTHGSLSQAQSRELWRIAKSMPCKYGLDCNDELCYAGHKCPYNPCTRGMCEFSDEMHYDGAESSRGRTAMKTDGGQETCRKEEHSEHRDNKGHAAASVVCSNREEIKLEVDELMNEIAPRKNDRPELRGTIASFPCESGEHKMKPLKENFARSYLGSQVSTPHPRYKDHADILSHVFSGRSRASSGREKHGEKRSGGKLEDDTRFYGL